MKSILFGTIAAISFAKLATAQLANIVGGGLSDAAYILGELLVDQTSYLSRGIAHFGHSKQYGKRRLKITVPINESSDRYILASFVDAYTNTFEAISRRNYPNVSKIWVYGPNSPPAIGPHSDFDIILTFPTDLTWVVIRTEMQHYNNASNLVVANAIQSTYALSQYYSQVSRRNSSILVPLGVSTINPLYFWKSLRNLVVLFPPPFPLGLLVFSSLGLTEFGFDSTGLSLAVINSLEAAKGEGGGDYGINFLLRAALAISGGGFGFNSPADTVYFPVYVDSTKEL
ncbi:hypothetical protein HK100_003333 [Physocladia obscura]|uniref:DUF1254 domain-containing protein n=1 Tax=Physocladia obscura TaxID=109957 RepID=A0AAD5SU40_9FUNG|nr:hypothetical protein HK100_003333 [Physocladia obscura]